MAVVWSVRSDTLERTLGFAPLGLPALPALLFFGFLSLEADNSVQDPVPFLSLSFGLLAARIPYPADLKVLRRYQQSLKLIHSRLQL